MNYCHYHEKEITAQECKTCEKASWGDEGWFPEKCDFLENFPDNCEGCGHALEDCRCEDE